MSNLLEELIKLNPDLRSLDEQKIVDSEGSTLGWNHYFFNNSGYPIAGGTAPCRETSKRIAVAECFEREIFKKIITVKELRDALFLNESPSTSGFAAGFERSGTSFRSICEAVERWAWSKWIDDNYFIPKVETPKKLSELACELQKPFAEKHFYQVSLPNFFCADQVYSLVLSVFLGLKDGGVFAGSRVTTLRDDPWEHAIIEARRNYNNFLSGPSAFLDNRSIITERIHYFAVNYDEAKRQIDLAKIIEWPKPKIRVHKEVDTGISGLYLFRTLCSEFVYWHLGDRKRFVY